MVQDLCKHPSFPQTLHKQKGNSINESIAWPQSINCKCLVGPDHLFPSREPWMRFVWCVCGGCLLHVCRGVRSTVLLGSHTQQSPGLYVLVWLLHLAIRLVWKAVALILWWLYLNFYHCGPKLSCGGNSLCFARHPCPCIPFSMMSHFLFSGCPMNCSLRIHRVVLILSAIATSRPPFCVPAPFGKCYHVVRAQPVGGMVV